MQKQHDLLNQVSRLVAAGEIVTMITQNLCPMSLATLKEIHTSVESGKTVAEV